MRSVELRWTCPGCWIRAGERYYPGSVSCDSLQCTTAHPTAAGCEAGGKWLLCLPASSTKSTDAKAKKEEKFVYDIHRSVQECVFHKNLILGEIRLMGRNINQEAATDLAAVCAKSLSLLFLTIRCLESRPNLSLCCT